MTTIEWTDETWNPTTGCDQVSPGCDNCYALTMARRLKAMGSAKYQRDGDPRTSGPGFGVTAHPDVLDAPLRWRKPRKVFVNSTSDLFHAGVSDEFIARVFAVMAATPQHTYQVLTKRHGRMRSLLSADRWLVQVAAAGEALGLRDAQSLLAGSWPLPNFWIGVSVEDQKRADLRIPALLDTPAAVRFVRHVVAVRDGALRPRRPRRRHPRPRLRGAHRAGRPAVTAPASTGSLAGLFPCERCGWMPVDCTCRAHPPTTTPAPAAPLPARRPPPPPPRPPGWAGLLECGCHPDVEIRRPA